MTKCSKNPTKEFPDWPPSIMVELTTICNLHCPLCVIGSGELKRPPKSIDFDLYANLIAEVRGHSSKFTLYGQGEPFLHPRLIRIVHLASSNGISTHISTNGHFLKTNQICTDLIEAGLSSISISLDGASSGTYRHYRVGGDFEKVVTGIKRLLKVRTELNCTTPLVQIQFLVFKHNEHEIPNIRELALAMGVDRLHLKTAQVYTPDQAHQYLPAKAQYSRYDLHGQLRVSQTEEFRCWHLTHQPLITVTGDVVPCCFDKNAEFVMGSLREKSLYEIWHSTRYQRFRNTVARNRSSVSMCRNCDQGIDVPSFYREELGTNNGAMNCT